MNSATILAFALLVSSAGAQEDEFRPLFNGENLDGWVLVNTPPATWTVKEGMLVCSGKPIGEIRTERMYQNFVLELEWRHMRPRGNAGVFVWADDITARGVPFHRSIEVQVLENAYGNTRSYTTHGDIFPIHGARMTPLTGRRRGSRAFPTEQRSRPSPEWNHYRINCNDGEISLAVNGKVVTRGRDCSPRKGYICLESEGGIVHYRNIRIKQLPETPIEAKHLATSARGYRSLYSGLDLTGWTAADESMKHWQPRNWLLSYNAGGGHPLSTTETFGDFGFLIDLRLRDDARPPTLLLRGSEKAPIKLDPTDPAVQEHLAAAGKWNRLEGTLRGKQLTLSLNGHELFADKTMTDVPTTGPLTISPEGPVELANLFIRTLNE